MSYRSVSALPTCLYARLAFSRPLQPTGFATCWRCRHDLAQAIAGQDDTDPVRDGINPARGDEVLSGRIARIARKKMRSPKSYIKRVMVDSPRDDTQRHHTPSMDASLTSRRIGGRLKSPSFVSQKNIYEYGYKDWEVLHDHFLEVRRTRPDQMAELFNEQRMFAKRFLGDISFDKAAGDQFNKKWYKMYVEDRIKALPHLLIGSLAESATMTLFVLEHVGSIPYPFLIRMNCLRSVRMIYYKEFSQSTELRNKYAQQLEPLRSPDMWPTNNLPGVLLDTLLFFSSPAQCSAIIREYSERYDLVDTTCLVAIIDHYLREKDPQQALEYFKRFPEQILRQPDDIVLRLRDKLLKLDIVAKTESGTNFKYLPQLLGLGIPPDEALHNTVIESAIFNGLPDVAWDLYQYLERSQFQSNARSHLVLLRDAFLRGDLPRVNEIMTAIHRRDDLASDPYLVAYSMNIVRNITCYEKQLGPHEARSHIMALYDRSYDRGPLLRLGIVQSSEDIVDLLEPPPVLLAFTIWTYTLIQPKDTDVLRLWQRIKDCISKEDRAVVEAGKSDVIYNGFILYFTRKPATLSRALEIVQYMLSSRLWLPSARTWSILLCGFLKHGQVEQARKILALMQAKGFPVQVVTERYSDYVPAGWDLQALADRVNENLDERGMPPGIEVLLGDSASLQGDI